SMIASGVYVLNDLLDLAADRAHPRKRNRPLASGAMPILHGTILAPALLLAGLVLAVPVGARFVAVMLGYLILTTAYSLRLKRLLVVDIVALSALYTVRIVAGGAASDIELSVWLLAFSVFFFFSLAAVKRQAELVDNIASGKDKPAGRGYLASDLPLVETMAVGAGFVSVLVMALYLDSPNVRVLYNQPGALWGICMVLLYWISRMVMLGHRGLMDDDPVIFAAKDRVSQVSALVIFAFALMGVLL
ncbi:MAG: UbiA family prenyltransferase, partial [Paracoccaceae bacterium]|nr:UbiA family prenyltransferase [Paracoccaceae bacterium]